MSGSPPSAHYCWEHWPLQGWPCTYIDVEDMHEVLVNLYDYEEDNVVALSWDGSRGGIIQGAASWSNVNSAFATLREVMTINDFFFPSIYQVKV